MNAGGLGLAVAVNCRLTLGNYRLSFFLTYWANLRFMEEAQVSNLQTFASFDGTEALGNPTVEGEDINARGNDTKALRFECFDNRQFVLGRC